MKQRKDLELSMLHFCQVQNITGWNQKPFYDKMICSKVPQFNESDIREFACGLHSLTLAQRYIKMFKNNELYFYVAK